VASTGAGGDSLFGASGFIGSQVVGLRELQAAFRKTGKGSGHFIQVRLKQVATLVASAVAGRVIVGLTGHAAASVRPVATQQGAGVVAGGPRAPYYPWLEFGGSTGPGHERGKWQGQIWSSGAGGHSHLHRVAPEWGGKPGRWMYPTIIDMGDVIVHECSEALHDALADAGWKAA
jgi:hypothetical protein